MIDRFEINGKEIWMELKQKGKTVELNLFTEDGDKYYAATILSKGVYFHSYLSDELPIALDEQEKLNILEIEDIE